MAASAALPALPARPIRYARYAGEADIPKIMALVDTELSEPYNWYTYRYFLQGWYVASACSPRLCYRRKILTLSAFWIAGLTCALWRMTGRCR